MRVVYTSANNRVRVEFDADGTKALFGHLSQLADVLEVEPCGQCKSTAVVHEHRVRQTFDYYSFRCRSCGAELSLGQYKDGRGLFVKRQDEDGKPVGKNGWHHYKPEGQRGDR